MAGLAGGGWWLFLRDDDSTTTATDADGSSADEAAAEEQDSGEDSEDANPDGLPSVTGEISWTAPYEELDATGLLGAWFTDDLAVRGGYSTLIGYDAASGSEAWRADLGSERRFCGMSEHIVDGVGLVAVADADGINEITEAPDWVCSTVVAIDVASGEELAEHELATDEFMPGDSVHPELVGDHWVVRQQSALHVIPAGGDGEAATLHPEALGADDISCQLADFLPNADVVEVLIHCREDRVQVFTVDPASVDGDEVTPTATSGAPLPESEALFLPYLVSADPHVVVLSAFTEQGAVLVLDGENVTTIEQEGDWGRLDLNPITRLGSDDFLEPSRDRFAVALTDDTIYLRTENDPASELRDTNEIVAFGLDGEHRWSQSLGETLVAELVTPVDNGILAISHGNYEDRPQLFHLAAEDGTLTELGPPWEEDEGALIRAPAGAQMHWDGSALILVPPQNAMMADVSDFVYRLS